MLEYKYFAYLYLYVKVAFQLSSVISQQCNRLKCLSPTECENFFFFTFSLKISHTRENK